jgi:peptidoglycan/xylan/chitin deacetylase (PgdA/CDA1 family)
VLSLGTLTRALADGEPIPAGAVAITLDDGYADNAEYALPELAAMGLRATVFVTTGPMMRREPLWTAELGMLIERTRRTRVESDGRYWALDSSQAKLNTRRGLTRQWASLAPEEVGRRIRELARDVDVPFGQADQVVMDSSGVRTWQSAGLELGAHTMRHPNLVYQESAVMREEIEGSARDLEAVTGHRPEAFVYPNCGNLPRHHSPKVSAMVGQVGFRVALTSDQGAITPRSERLALPRLSVAPRLWNTDLLDTEIERLRFRGLRRAR